LKHPRGTKDVSEIEKGGKVVSGQLQGRVALVTGGGSGIGRATALTFAREGAHVVVSDVAVEGGEETVGLVKAAGGDASFVAADVSKAADVEQLIRRTVETYGRVDCAHNNAGILRGGPLHKTSEEEWSAVLAVNLTGVWLCMKYEIAQMLRQGGGGAIVNTSSGAGLVGSPNAAYTASKFGVVGLTKSAAMVYGARGIRINAVCPGWIDTPMVHDGMEDAEALAQRIAMEPIGRIGTPDEVAEAVVWLCSDAASFVLGVAMPVDGGLAR
jgi:NAD(P)-dependent dehydrogenase (short-subunit alcohol dehydrogenase family)